MEHSEQSTDSELPINLQREQATSSNFYRKERATKDVVKSIRRRVFSCEREQSDHKTRQSLRKSMSLDSKLKVLCPAFGELSVEAREGYSLNRYRPKQVLPYYTIFGMYLEEGWGQPFSTSPSRPCTFSASGGRQRRMSDPSVFRCDKLEKGKEGEGREGEEVEEEAGTGDDEAVGEAEKAAEDEAEKGKEDEEVNGTEDEATKGAEKESNSCMGMTQKSSRRQMEGSMESNKIKHVEQRHEVAYTEDLAALQSPQQTFRPRSGAIARRNAK